MKKILAGVALIGTAVSAQAADLAVKAPYYKAPIVAVYDWTGFYIGVNGGGGVGRDRTSLNVPGPTSSDTTYLSPAGGLGGGQIGYNWQTGSFLGPIVFGVEADIQGADLTDNRTSLLGFGGFNAQYNQKLDWFGTVRGRVGLVTGPVMTYVTAGYAYGGVRTSVAESVGGVGIGAFTADRTQGGFTYGSGIEAAIGGNWTAKVEYLYLDLGNKTNLFALGGVPQALNTEVRENIYRVGLNYRIGGNSTYVPTPAANWTGFYLGGNVGGAVARDRSNVIAAGVNELFNLSPDGIIGGVQGGYNWQASNWVFGIEADIQASSQQDNRTCVLTCSTAPLPFAAFDARLPYFGTVRGRLGYAVGSTLFYGTGGYAYGRVKTNVTSSVLTPQSFNSDADGYAVGGGIETPFTFLNLFGPNWTTTTEYLYVDLGRVSNTVTAPGFGAVTASTHVSEHIFRTGLNYHFNSPVVAKY